MPYQPCPVCSAPAKGVCRCKRSDTTCANGHKWHICPVHDVIVIGLSDHAAPMTQCSCKKRNPQFAGIGDSTWQFPVVAILGGISVMAMIGRPTLLHLFSSSLEMQLWDKGDVIKENLIAMAVILGIVVAWSKFSKTEPSVTA